jgi:hypothetical protein
VGFKEKKAENPSEIVCRGVVQRTNSTPNNIFLVEHHNDWLALPDLPRILYFLFLTSLPVFCCINLKYPNSHMPITSWNRRTEFVFPTTSRNLMSNGSEIGVYDKTNLNITSFQTHNHRFDREMDM